MIKSADFLEGATQTILSKFAPSQWMSKPFETIFSALGPVLIWKISWPLGIMAFIGEHLGYGPGYIGRLIDEHLGAGAGQKLDLSDEKLKSASESAVDEFLKKTQSMQTTSADLFLNQLIQIKGVFNKEDIVTAFYVAKYNKIQKIAIGGPGIVRRFLGLLSGNKYKIGITSVLYNILKMFAKGIIGAAAVGGVASMIGGITPTTSKSKEEGFIPPSEHPGVKNQQYYSNVAKNVEETLIKFLDATISGFSDTFEKVYKKPLQGSKEMREILNIIESINKSNIFNINSWDAFMAPAVLDVAYKLMPMATYEKVNTEQKGVDSKTKLVKLLGEV